MSTMDPKSYKAHSLANGHVYPYKCNIKFSALISHQNSVWKYSKARRYLNNNNNEDFVKETCTYYPNMTYECMYIHI